MEKEKQNAGIIYGEQNFSFPNHMNYGKFLLERLSKEKAKVALINGASGEKLTFGEMTQQIVNIASAIKQLGIGKGDVVAICSENRTEYLTTTIAVLCTGATVTFINSAYSKSEFIHTTKISKPNYIFLSPSAYKEFYVTLKELNIVQKFFLFGISDDKDVTSFKDLVTKYTHFNDFVAKDFNGTDSTSIILYSSGTTGLPKGVKLTHRNLLVTGFQKSFCQKDLVVLTLAPWCNTVGIILTLLNISKNRTVLYLNKFQEDVYLQCIEKYKAGILLMVPPLLVILTKSKLIDKYDVSSVQIMYCGGAPLDSSVMTSIKKRFTGLKHVLQGYGMTETTGALTEEREDSNKLGSVGKVVEGNIVKVVDVETRKTLGPNQNGEICVKGPVLFEDYIGKDINEDLDEDGFYKTGDIAYYDNEGYFYIVDRIKELIKYKAGQVAPSELEAILLQHDAVQDVGVAGAPDPLVGELPTAFVVKKPNSKVTEKELIDFVAARVSSWKQLRGGVRFVNEIPKTGSGKILRRILRDSLTKPPASKL